MKGSCVLVSANPQGKFLGGILNDTSVPGTIMMVDPVTPFTQNGEPFFIAYNPTTAGEKAQYAILLEDRLQGGIYSGAGVAGTWRQFYVPYPGEDMNVLYGQSGGTSNSVTAGDILTPDSGNGVLIEWTGTQDRAFQAMETLTAIANATLLWVRKY